ncbi:hypothetical protein OIY81_201 [Cryptosporidium canis]|nr:hypothetical protein OIY81_201 [Cryptosporidium canis]
MSECHSVLEIQNATAQDDAGTAVLSEVNATDGLEPNLIGAEGYSEADPGSSHAGQSLPADSSRPGHYLFEKKSPRDEQQREKESKQALKSVMKLQNEIFHINNSIVSQENAYKSSLFSNKYMGNIFSSYYPFIVGINKFTLRPKERSPDEVMKSIRKNSDVPRDHCEYIKYSTQWYLWAKRRNAEILSQNHVGNAEQSSSNVSSGGAGASSMAGNASKTSNSANTAVQSNIGQIFHSNQLQLQKEIQNIEQSVKFRLALQPDKPLFPFNSRIHPSLRPDQEINTD